VLAHFKRTQLEFSSQKSAWNKGERPKDRKLKNEATKNDTSKNVSAKSESVESDFSIDPSKSLFQRFNENLRKYWYVMVPVHIVTSGGYFIGFCYLAWLGVSPVPLLKKFEVFKEALETIENSKYELIAVALLFQKIASPLRYLTTWHTVKALAGRGKLMPSKEFFQYVKNRYLNWRSKK